jgi:hypothetical protein
LSKEKREKSPRHSLLVARSAFLGTALLLVPRSSLLFPRYRLVAGCSFLAPLSSLLAKGQPAFSDRRPSSCPDRQTRRATMTGERAAACCSGSLGAFPSSVQLTSTAVPPAYQATPCRALSSRAYVRWLDADRTAPGWSSRSTLPFRVRAPPGCVVAAGCQTAGRRQNESLSPARDARYPAAAESDTF